jgi:hypothetical protein
VIAGNEMQNLQNIDGSGISEMLFMNLAWRINCGCAKTAPKLESSMSPTGKRKKKYTDVCKTASGSSRSIIPSLHQAILMKKYHNL